VCGRGIILLCLKFFLFIFFFFSWTTASHRECDGRVIPTSPFFFIFFKRENDLMGLIITDNLAGTRSKNPTGYSFMISPAPSLSIFYFFFCYFFISIRIFLYARLHSHK
jgi:hypothetical protein